MREEDEARRESSRGAEMGGTKEREVRWQELRQERKEKRNGRMAKEKGTSRTRGDLERL